jgi:hypothetical protein
VPRIAFKSPCWSWSEVFFGVYIFVLPSCFLHAEYKTGILSSRLPRSTLSKEETRENPDHLITKVPVFWWSRVFNRNLKGNVLEG